jgi:hypothetical protein
VLYWRKLKKIRNARNIRVFFLFFEDNFMRKTKYSKEILPKVKNLLKKLNGYANC